jgi:hypothetical protein
MLFFDIPLPIAAFNAIEAYLSVRAKPKAFPETTTNSQPSV